MTKPVKNFAASVRQRLLNLSKENDADYNAMLQRFTRERFLYRLGMSSEVDRFTLKGAALFVVWGGGEFRPTKDVDLLGSGSPDHAVVRRQVEAVLSIPCPEDGLTFEPSLTNVESIHEEEKYVGVRVRLEGRLGRAKLPLQVDIGFGDAVTPGRSEAEYPTLLDLPIPRTCSTGWTFALRSGIGSSGRTTRAASSASRRSVTNSRPGPTSCVTGPRHEAGGSSSQPTTRCFSPCRE